LSDDGFAEFYQRTFAQVLSATLMASGHRGDAEDAVQEAYIIALRRWAEVGRYDAPEAWVLKVALRRLWRSQRRHRHAAQLAVTVPPGASPEETAYAREVIGALATLPPPVRIAMVMCAVLGWSQAEVAEVLQVPRNTIANRIFRGRAKLAAQLGMTEQVTGVRDPLVPTQGPVARFAALAEDPVGEALTRAESWLRAGIEAEPEPGPAGRIWTQVIESATAGEGVPEQPTPRRLLGRLAARRRGGADLDG
jgi:RNA polymerase sigma factor (sigma-70 family)